MAQLTGVKSFIKKAAENRGKTYSEENANEMLKSYDYNYDKLIEDVGKHAGYSDDKLASFKNEMYSHYDIPPIDEETKPEIEYLTQDVSIPDVESGFERYNILKEQADKGQALINQLQKKFRPADIPEIDKTVEPQATTMVAPAIIPDEIDEINRQQAELSKDILTGQTRLSDVQKRYEDIQMMLKEQADKNIYETGFASEEHKNIHEQAQANKRKIDDAIDKMQKGAGKKFGYGVTMGIPQSVPKPEDARKVKDLKDIKSMYDNMEKVLSAPRGKGLGKQMQGFLHGLTKNTLTRDFLTLGLTEMSRNINVKNAFDNLQEAKSKIKDTVPEENIEQAAMEMLPKNEQALLETYQLMKQVESGEEGNLGATLGQGLQDMMPFIVEFAATSGTGTLAKNAVQKFLANRIKSSIAKRVIGSTAKIGTQAAIMPSTPKEIAERMAPKLGEDERLEKGAELGEAAVKGYLTIAAEVLGEDVASFAAKFTRGKILKSLKQNPSRAQEVLSRIGLSLTAETGTPTIQGLPFEILSEEVTGIAQAAIDKDGSFFTPEAQMHMILLSAIASGSGATFSLPAKVKVKRDLSKAQELLADIPDANYSEAVSNAVVNYSDPEELIATFDEISKEYEVSEEDYLKARHYIARNIAYNSMSNARSSQIAADIARFKDDDGNVTLTVIDGKKYYVRNSNDLGEYNRTIYARDEDGNVQPFNSAKIKQWETKTPDEIQNDAKMSSEAEIEDAMQEEDIITSATERGIEDGKTIETPNGKKTVVSINPDQTVTVVNDKGEETVERLDEVEAYKTQEEKDAEKAQQKEAERVRQEEEKAREELMDGIDPNANIDSDESLDIPEFGNVRVIDFDNGQSKMITDEAEQVFNSAQERDAALNEILKPTELERPNLDEMPAEEAYSLMREQDPEAARETLIEEIESIRSQANELRTDKTGTRQQRFDNKTQALELEAEAARLEEILAAPEVAEEEDIKLKAQPEEEVYDKEDEKRIPSIEQEGQAIEQPEPKLEESKEEIEASRVLEGEEKVEVPYLDISEKAAADLKDRRQIMNSLTKISDEMRQPAHIINSSEIPEAVASEEKRRIASDRRAVAFVYNGEAYIISDRVQNVSEAKKSYIHELLVHKKMKDAFLEGEQEIIGKYYKRFNDLMIDVYGSMSNKDKLDIAQQYFSNTYKDYYDEKGREKLTVPEDMQTYIAEEFMATLSELEKIPTKWEQFIDKLVQLFRKAFGFTSKQFTRSDLFNILSDQRRKVLTTPETKTPSEITDDSVMFRTEVEPDYKKWKKQNVTVRGVKGDPYEAPEKGNNKGAAMLGLGLYTAPISNKKMAKEYGDVYFVTGARPKKPKKFDSLNEWEIWMQNHMYNTLGLKRKSEFSDKGLTIEGELQRLGYDGIEIKGREIVNFNPDDVRYFKTENELKDYHEALTSDIRFRVAESQQELDDFVKDSRIKKRVYHQTTKEGRELITKEGFKKGFDVAALSDFLLPSAFFFKSSPEDIGLKGKEQVPAYVNAKNPLKVENRDELSVFLSDNIPGFAESIFELNEIDSSFGAKLDKSEKELDKFYADNWDGKTKISNLPGYKKIVKASDDILSEWKNTYEKAAIKTKQLTNDYFKNSEYDSIMLKQDEGGFGKKTTDAIVVFDDSQVLIEKEDDVKFRIAESQQELDDFVKDSKVKETVYHGTMYEFDTFEVGQGDMIYFTPNKLFAEAYGAGMDYTSIDEEELKESGVNVISAKVNIENMFDANNYDHTSRIGLEEGEVTRFYDDMQEYASDIKDAGFDGIIMEEGKYKGAPISYGVFSPNQILIEPKEDVKFKLEKAREETDTNPSDAQKEAGNYKKGNVKFDGFDISIENPKGSVRSGVDQNGKEWSHRMPADYGYFKGTIGNDKDHIDTFIGENPESDKVYVIDQVDPNTGEFDEHKVMIGFNSIADAKKAYRGAYDKDWKGLGNITRTTKDELKEWFKQDDKSIPFAEGDIRFKEDDGGEIVFHGTNEEFNKYNLSIPKSYEDFGDNMYLSNSRDIARYYGKNIKSASIPSSIITKTIDAAGNPMRDIADKFNGVDGIIKVENVVDYNLEGAQSKEFKFGSEGDAEYKYPSKLYIDQKKSKSIKRMITEAKSKGVNLFDTGSSIVSTKSLTQEEAEILSDIGFDVKQQFKKSPEISTVYVITSEKGLEDIRNANYGDIRFRIETEDKSLEAALEKIRKMQQKRLSKETIKELKKTAVDAPEDERQNIIDKIDVLQQGIRLGEKETKDLIKEVQSALVDYAKKNVPSGDAGKRDVDSIITLIKNSQTPRSLSKAFDKVDEIAGNVSERKERSRLMRSINKTIGWMTGLKKQGQRRVGKFVIEDTRAFKELDRINKESIKLTSILNSVKKTKADKAKAEEDLDRLRKEIEDRPDKTSLDNVLIKIIEMRRNGSKSTVALVKVINEELTEIYNKAKDAKSELDMDKALLRTEDREFVESFLESATKFSDKNLLNKLGTKLNNYTANVMGNWETLMMMIGGNKLRDKFSLVLNQVNQELGVQGSFDIVLDEAMKSYGLDSREKMLKKIQDLKKAEYDLVKPLRNNERGKGEAKPLSKMMLIDIYNAIKNGDIENDYYLTYGDIVIDEEGNYDRDAQREIGRRRITELLGKLNESDKSFGDSMQKQLDAYYDRVNEVFIKTFNIDLKKVMNYWPSTAEREGESDVFNQFISDTKHPGATKERSAHRKPVPADAFDKFAKHVKENEWYINMALPLDRINKVFSNNDVRDLIVESRGKVKPGVSERKGLYGTIQSHIEQLGLQGSTKNLTDMERTFGNVLGNWVSAKIGATPSVPIKQLTSVINYAENMPPGEWLTGFIAATANPLATWKEMYNNIPYLKARFKGGYSEAMQYAMDAVSSMPKAKNWHQAMKNIVTSGTRYGDIIAIVYGGKPYVDYLKKQNIKKGMSQEDATKDAYDQFMLDTLRSQQSPFSSTLSIYQNSKNPLAKAFFTFANTPSQYMRKMLEANQAYKHGDISFAQLAKIYSIYGIANQFLYVAAGAMVASIMRGTDFDDDLLEQSVAQSITSLFGGIPILRDVITTTTRQAIGLKVYDTELPVLTELIDATRKSVMALQETDDPDKVAKYQKDIVMTVLELGGVPVRNIDKVIRRSEIVEKTETRKVDEILKESSKNKSDLDNQLEGKSTFYKNRKKKTAEYKSAEVAHKLKYTYSGIKSKATKLEKKGNKSDADRLMKLIERSKQRLSETSMLPSDMKREIMYIERNVKYILGD